MFTSDALQKVPPCTTMNETDVRENIVAPFLAELGYRYGTSAHLGTEKQLIYNMAFLGRKKKSDPPLKGKADYICDVISFGRFVVEVKKPAEELSLDVSQQAYTYAAHPEVGAWYYLITNGFDWRLYRIGDAINPILSWSFLEIPARLSEIKNILGPQAIKDLHKRATPLVGKPIVAGLGSAGVIHGGLITYDQTTCNTPGIEKLLGVVQGLTVGVRGGTVSRIENQIIAIIEQSSAYKGGDSFNKALGMDKLTYLTADEYISEDPEQPSIFQNYLNFHAQEGIEVPAMYGNPASTLELDMYVEAFTQAVGHYTEGKFIGSFKIDYLYKFVKQPILPPMLKRIVTFSTTLEMQSVGSFELNLN